jgi:hypothetical protein
MIIGLLPDGVTTETFLNNLAEAEFNLRMESRRTAPANTKSIT